MTGKGYSLPFYALIIVQFSETFIFPAETAISPVETFILLPETVIFSSETIFFYLKRSYYYRSSRNPDVSVSQPLPRVCPHPRKISPISIVQTVCTIIIYTIAASNRYFFVNRYFFISNRYFFSSNRYFFLFSIDTFGAKAFLISKQDICFQRTGFI